MASIKSLIDAFDVNQTNRALLVSALRALSRKTECGRLTKSGASLLFAPHKGNVLSINGNDEEIPDAGVTLGVGGLSASTTYFIYAFMSAGVLTLEASTTGHATQAGTGVEIKSGDATRSLVGMARTIAGPAFEDVTGSRLVRSWLHDAFRTFPKRLGIDTNVTSTTYATVTTLNLLTFRTRLVVRLLVGGVQNQGGSPNQLITDFRVDGGAEQAIGLAVAVPDLVNEINEGYWGGSEMEITVTEGYHTLDVRAKTGATPATQTTTMKAASTITVDEE